MKQEYTYPKQKFQKEEIKKIEVFFDNGDFLTMYDYELIDISVTLYDRLIWNGAAYSPVAESGFLKFKIKEKTEKSYDANFLYNPNEYKKNRKVYIENRCINEGGLRYVCLYDELNWHYSLYGNPVAEMSGKYLIIKFIPQVGFGSSSGDNHVIYLNDVNKSIIRSIELDFENCDVFSIYHNEISEVRLEFEKGLEWGSGDVFRKIRSGYIKIKLDKEIYNRHMNSWFADKRKKSIRQLENRICRKQEKDTHDLCHLYVYYDYHTLDMHRSECLQIDDIRPDEELERLEALEEAGEGYVDFIGGYCSRADDGTITITFGKDSEALLDKLNEKNS